jgi:hypothetical protein
MNAREQKIRAKLGQLLTSERDATFSFYQRMSGQIPWESAEGRQRFVAKFDALSFAITQTQNELRELLESL